MNESTENTEQGALSTNKDISVGDSIKSFVRAELKRLPKVTVEEVEQAYTMTKDERRKVHDARTAVENERTAVENERTEVSIEPRDSFPEVYDPLHFTEMKAALEDPSITPECRSGIISALIRQHLHENRQITRARRYKEYSDLGRWNELDKVDKEVVNNYMWENFPSTPFKDTRAHAVRGFTHTGGTSKPVLTTEGLIAFQTTAAGNLAKDLHRDVSGTMYAKLSDIPDET
ncbi:hypothetical protein I302_106574 [Kwoniella bestiolae CBS 10118]|uniref:Uncharacterized protein n=1 Tax=Kwoniella bestiolae CBS 10118 TaxID=1296100 RepID=A0A1B9G107_9TREE|nr:hypothetical protein I302_06164 [Kwoniella bestiolae CBS 10118]OCF24703.1 hypothetical protein I302_06164 [Kwoniella bestiolae CBS 10118]